MSLDLYLKEPCEHCEKISSNNPTCFEWNYTYNLSSVWYKACPEDNKMIDIDGMTGNDALPKLTRVRVEIERHRDEWRSLNPPNGWGDIDSFIDALKNLERACIDYPKGIWGSSR